MAIGIIHRFNSKLSNEKFIKGKCEVAFMASDNCVILDYWYKLSCLSLHIGLGSLWVCVLVDLFCLSRSLLSSHSFRKWE